MFFVFFLFCLWIELIAPVKKRKISVKQQSDHVFLCFCFSVFLVAVRPFSPPWACLYIISGAGLSVATLQDLANDPGRKIVDYCLMFIFNVATPFRHQDLNILPIFPCPWSSITLSRSCCREAKILTRAQLWGKVRECTVLLSKFPLHNSLHLIVTKMQ